METPYMGLRAGSTRKGDMSDMPSQQPTEQPCDLPAEIEGVRTHASTSLLRMSTGVFFLASKCDWRPRSLKKKVVEVARTRGVEDQTGWP